MSLLLETIKFRDGIPCNLQLHQERVDRSLVDLSGTQFRVNLEQSLLCPDNLRFGIVKCRVIYDTEIRSVTYEPYIPRAIRTLLLTEDNSIEYSHKYLDRSCFAKLLEGVEEDDILICRHGCITDTSFANIIFRDGDNWVTPDTPLLKGTKRQELISRGMITGKSIKVTDLNHFSEARIINAMLDPGDVSSIEISNIKCKISGRE